MQVQNPMFAGMSDRAKRLALKLLEDQIIAGLKLMNEECSRKALSDFRDAVTSKNWDLALSRAMNCMGACFRPAELDIAKMLDEAPPSDEKAAIALLVL